MQIEAGDYPQGNDKRQWPDQVAHLISEAEQGREEAAVALLHWLKDLNWPGAQRAAAFLSEHIDAVFPRIEIVLRGDDEVWKYWILNCLMDRMPEGLIRKLVPQLISLTQRDDREEVNLSAARVLCERNACARDELTEIVERVERFNPKAVDEIAELRALFQ